MGRLIFVPSQVAHVGRIDMRRRAATQAPDWTGLSISELTVSVPFPYFQLRCRSTVLPAGLRGRRPPGSADGAAPAGSGLDWFTSVRQAARMGRKAVSIADARIHLSRLLARVERGERIVIARAGRPVAELRPVRKLTRRSVALNDPLLRVDEYSYGGPIGPTTNSDIDRTVYDL